MEPDSLVVFERGAQLLAQADTIQKAKEFKDLALTAADWAKRCNLGQQAVECARSYALRAERRMGELLAATDRNKGAKGSFITGTVRVPVKDDAPTLAELGIRKKESSRAQKLAKVSDSKFETLLAGKVNLTAVMESHNHRAQGTGQNEWYTPEEELETVRAVLGKIELDPASSAEAQKRVKAARYFTAEEDGLNQPWRGKVFLNPPYSQPAIAQFSEKLVAEVSSGAVSEAIALTHNYTDTAWFHTLASSADAICFTRGRVAFVNAEGVKAAPTQGQAFFYFGTNRDAFKKAFRDHGCVLKRL
jgi:ParB family chromosome partitioning protein